MDLVQSATRVGHVLERVMQHDEVVLPAAPAEVSFQKSESPAEIAVSGDERIDTGQPVEARIPHLPKEMAGAAPDVEHGIVQTGTTALDPLGPAGRSETSQRPSAEEALLPEELLRPPPFDGAFEKAILPRS